MKFTPGVSDIDKWWKKSPLHICFAIFVSEKTCFVELEPFAPFAPFALFREPELFKGVRGVD